MIAAPESGRIWGGIGTYLRQLTQGLGARHELIVLGGADAESAEGNVRTVPFEGRDAVMATYLEFQFALRRRLPGLIREYRPDLLVVHHAQMPDLLSAYGGCPVVVTAHTTILGQSRGTAQALRRGSPLDGSERTVMAGLPALLAAEVFYWRRVRHALFVSEAVRQEVLGTYAPRLRTSAKILNGFAPEESPRAAEPREDLREEPGFILYMGRLLGWKGLVVLLQAMRRTKRPERLVLTGSGRVDAWQRFAGSLGLGRDRVEFLGAIPRAELLSRLRQAKAVVLPSFTESCPYSLIEAMAFGKPAVVSSLPGTRDMVEDGASALLVPPGDPAALATALERVLEDESLARRLGQEAALVARERFSLERMSGETVRYFEQVLASP